MGPEFLMCFWWRNWYGSWERSWGASLMALFMTMAGTNCFSSQGLQGRPRWLELWETQLDLSGMLQLQWGQRWGSTIMKGYLALTKWRQRKDHKFTSYMVWQLTLRNAHVLNTYTSYVTCPELPRVVMMSKDAENILMNWAHHHSSVPKTSHKLHIYTLLHQVPS